MLVCHLARLTGLDADVAAQLITSRYAEEIRLLLLLFKHFKSNREIRNLNKTALAPAKPPVQWKKGPFPGGKAAGTWCLINHPHLAQMLKKE